MALAGSYGTILSQKGFSPSLVGVGVVFIPFFASPIIISWFFKRYITKLYYNYNDDTYTAYHYGLLMNTRSLTFKPKDVKLSDITSALNTFTVNQGYREKPFFLHDQSLIDSDSVILYKKMLRLDAPP